MRKCLGAVSALFCLALTDTAVAEDTSSAAANKINVSGRQRMLSQMVAKQACFAHVRKQRAKQHLKLMGKAQEDFEHAAVALVEGDENLGIERETKPEVLTMLEGVSQHWQPLNELLDEAMSNIQVDKAELQEINGLSLAVLTNMQAAVGAIEDAYSQASLDPKLATTINFAGRQRMLSQKMAKELCLIAAEVDVDENRQALKESVALFEQTHASLVAGTDGMVAPNAGVARDFKSFESSWQNLRPAYRAALADQLTEQDISLVATQSERALVDMNRIVYRYTLYK